MDKKHIQIFIGGDSSCCNSSGGCGCGCSSSATPIVFDDLQKKYLVALNDIANFDVYKISDNQDNEDLINKLNEALRKSGEKLVADKSNLEFVLSQSAPIIAVNGMIISIKDYPDEKQLYDAVMFGKKISVKKGCC